MVKWLLSCAFVASLFGGIADAHAQCAVPNTFTAGTTALSAQVNANFSALTGCALPASGGTLTNGSLAGTTNLPGSGTISSTGNVGIGTSPATLLDVETANNRHIAVRDLSSTAQLLAMTNGAAAYAGMLIDGSTIAINTSSGGNVGIGTTVPAGKLDINTGANSDAVVYDSGNYNVISLSGTTTSDTGIVGGSSTDASLYVDANKTGGVINFRTSGTNWMVLTSTGSLGIGTTSPDTLLAAGNSSVSGNVAHFANSTGSCYINPTSTSLSCSSDRRLKTNIAPLGGDTLSSVLALDPVRYNWRKEAAGAAAHTGFIAQDVEKVFPDLVSPGPDGYLTLNYAGFSPYLTKALQQVAAISGAFKANLIAWFADASNGIGQFSAATVHAKKLCAETSAGAEICITGDQLAALLAERRIVAASAGLAASRQK